MIGTCGFTSFDYDARSAEIGYVINPKYHKMGIATEAASRVIKYGFESLGLHRIEAHYMVGNDASRKVMENIGMRFEGIHREAMFVKGAYVSIGVCAMTVGDYARLNSARRAF
jgi:ribosomal-protein-alanine N-acetyltransferase